MFPTASERAVAIRERLAAFMREEVYPAEARYKAELAEGPRWKVIPVVEELKARARAEGLRRFRDTASDVR